jgi:hypothetical protein
MTPPAELEHVFEVYREEEAAARHKASSEASTASDEPFARRLW